MAASKVTMKLMIDTKAKELYAEAGKECIDFLLHILALPMGSVIRLLMTKGMVGCLGNLYESLENLDNMYIQPNQNKNVLLKPKSASSFPLLLHTNTPHVLEEQQFYTCPMHNNYVTGDPQTFCPYTYHKIQRRVLAGNEIEGDFGISVKRVVTNTSRCGLYMNSKLDYVAPPAENMVACSNVGMVKGVITYMVFDDLVIKPMSTISSITDLLKELSITDVDALEEKIVTLGMDEALELLKSSLQSKNVLTSVFMENIKDY